MKKELIKDPIRNKWLPVIELHVQDLNLSWLEISRQTDISYNTIRSWCKRPEFMEACYQRYMELHGDKALYVIEALYNECLQGNVRAIELFLKHTGKYTEKKVHEISPSEAFMQSVRGKEIASADIEDGEIVQDPVNQLMNKVHEMPEPKPFKKPKVHPSVKDDKRKIAIATGTYKAYKVDKEKRNALLRLKRRAKKVGLASMGNGRPSKTEKAKWIEELLRLEKEKGIKSKPISL